MRSCRATLRPTRTGARGDAEGGGFAWNTFADGDVFVTWRDPTVLANEHGLAPDAGPLPNISALLQALAETATGNP